jgi:hypothetical protein
MEDHRCYPMGLRAYIKLVPAFVLLVILCACASPPKLATALDIRRTSSDTVLVKLTITNLENRVTVPIAIQLTGQAEENGQWQKSATVLQPAAFVLNRKEARTIEEKWQTSADAVRTTLTIREQETGNLLKSEKSEKRFATATTSQR